jgi:protein-export membrane protein SecD
MSPEERAKLPRSELLNLKNKAINLGLDLQGGMYLLMEVDKSKLSPEEAEGAVERAIEVIRNRIDQWGVYEPSIQRLGENRILVQLPGVLERERARSLIGRTALLEFKLLADDEVVYNLLDKFDKKLLELEGKIVPDTLDTLGISERPFSSLLNRFGRDIVVSQDNWKAIDSLLSIPEIKALIPKGYEFLWGKTQSVDGNVFRPLYLLRKEVVLTGAQLKTARHDIGTGTNPNIANKPIVHLSFNRQGAARFAAITGQNIGKRLAIVLDSLVQSAPVIQERIPGGNAMITGIESLEEAKELAVVLRAGALPAPVKIIEERSVGPLLGHDSIRKGTKALIIGMLLVLAFMIVYYSVSGVIADIALIFNLIFILALLAGLHATLTLPGLAGLILTVGMAVDANVLIFERIREELRSGKTPKIAVDSGYARAMVTILDANLTTLIAALVLLRFGTGPIRGFAVVLSIGIIVSFFTAIFMTKIIFDYLLVVRKIKEVRI